MSNPILEHMIGPEISIAIASALGDNRPESAVVKAKVNDPVAKAIELTGGNVVASWYKFFGNPDECVTLPDRSKYFIEDATYAGNGVFNVQLRKWGV